MERCVFSAPLLHRRKALLILRLSQCAVGVIAAFESSLLASSGSPIEWVSVEVFAFGLDKQSNVVPVAAPYIIVCGPRDHSTSEGVAGRHPIWSSLDREGTGHDPLPSWEFPAYPFWGSRTIDEAPGRCGVDLAEVAIRAFETTLEEMAYE